MWPAMVYETIRQLNEERVRRALDQHRWLYSERPNPAPSRDAEVIELIFASQCDPTLEAGA